MTESDTWDANKVIYILVIVLWINAKTKFQWTQNKIQTVAKILTLMAIV